MTIGETYLLSYEELNLIAAASGRGSFLMFASAGQKGREQQLQSVFRLINDGLLTQTGEGIRPSPSLFPLLRAFKFATTAVAAKLSNCEGAPVCLYYGGRKNSFLRITPSLYKQDLYEVGLVELDTLLDDLESSRFLPVLHDQDPIHDAAVPDDLPDDLADSLAWKDNILSTFEKFDLSTKMLMESISIVQTPFMWCLSSDTDCGKPVGYSKHSFTAWLNEEIK